MGTKLTIEGEPLVRFLFDYVPSTNEATNKARTHWSAGHSDTKKWRAQGEDLARHFIQRALKEGHDPHTFIVQRRAFLWVRVYRAAEWPTYDIHNPYLKPIADGFTDAGIWADDDWPNVPYVMFSWMPWDGRLLPNMAQNWFLIEVHELDAVTINGEAQILPMGRLGPRGED